MIYALYTVESVGERNVDKIPAQQGSYLNKEARNWMGKRRALTLDSADRCTSPVSAGGAVGGDAK